MGTAYDQIMRERALQLWFVCKGRSYETDSGDNCAYASTRHLHQIHCSEVADLPRMPSVPNAPTC